MIQITTDDIIPSSDFNCLIYGYGSLTYETNAISSNSLHYGTVVPISRNECEDIMGRVSAPNGLGQFCARGKAPKFVDACNGT